MLWDGFLMFSAIKLVLHYSQAKTMLWQCGETLENSLEISYRNCMTGQIKVRQEGVKYFNLRVLHKDKHTVN